LMMRLDRQRSHCLVEASADRLLCSALVAKLIVGADLLVEKRFADRARHRAGGRGGSCRIGHGGAT
jgi:hypothetical protein